MVERILDAAVRVLIERGYHDASTNRIAHEAGVSPGSVYQYFANKQEIIDSISLRLIEAMTANMEPVLRRAPMLPPAQAVPLVLGSALDSLQEQSELLRALADYRPAEEQRRNLAGLRGRLGDQVNIALALQAGGVTPVTERRSWLIVETCQTLLVRYVLDQPDFSRDEFIADLSVVVLELAGTGAAGE